MTNNDPLKAQPYFRQAVKLLPDLNNAHLNLGNTFLLLQQPDSAIAEYKLELHRNRRSVSAMINIGKAYALKGNMKRAKFYYRKAIKIDPASADAKALLSK